MVDLTKWFKEDWVDIGSKKKRVVAMPSVVEQNKRKMPKGKYPKCVPRAKANAMSKGQIKSAVKTKRKRAYPMSKGKNQSPKRRVRRNEFIC